MRDIGKSRRACILITGKSSFPANIRWAATLEVVRKNFLYDYFDHQKREADKYKKAGVAPRLIEFGGVHYIVPFNCRRREIPDTKIVENILRRCEAKYKPGRQLDPQIGQGFSQT